MKIEYSSSVNQRILGKLVHNEVITRLNITMQLLQDANPESFLELLLSADNYRPVDENGDEDQDNGYYPEIYEYWRITETLANDLRKRGEIIINELDRPVWGRTTTGQAILLDYVIGQIAEDMEILQGQKYDWSLNLDI